MILQIYYFKSITQNRPQGYGCKTVFQRLYLPNIFYPMVDYNPKTWLSLIFHSYSKFVVKTLFPALVFMGFLSFGVCYLVLDILHPDREEFQSTTAVHALLGIVLGLFLVFRINSAYDRWWEGRKLWGSLVNGTRNFALKINAYLPEDDQKNRQWFSHTVVNFVFACKEHLRNGVIMDELTFTDEKERQEIEKAVHKPNAIAGLLYKKVNALYKEGKLTGDHFFTLDKEMKEFIDIIGACERIKNTPIPYSYAMYIKKFIFTYIITLPVGFVTNLKYMTVPAVLIISFILLSVELIAEDIEDPFGLDMNDLPTDRLSVKIQEDLNEILGK